MRGSARECAVPRASAAGTVAVRLVSDDGAVLPGDMVYEYLTPARVSDLVPTRGVNPRP
ncbi:hypothetical protein T484DRAFT_1818403 [Baffinella frigidus]|nr:hypothetical protein T484DRAFT_1818403 [Cryptophyta sp. CCMP2293]